MHLTSEGQWRTRMSSPSLYGWDCESTLFFRTEVLEYVEEIEIPEHIEQTDEA